ncbi:MAG: hypothetical protein QOJ07_458 [Thermoleophilaceae bacterium]|jgi:uncharacterized membrane protein YdbT with pleckstrin-like domain|nr:hypothetical protein [Thermoleophilaceae bacterium]
MDYTQGEKVIYEGRPSWRSIVGFYLMGLIVVAVAAAIGVVASGAAIGAAAGGAVLVIVLIAGWFKRIGTRYAITDRRVRIQRGIFSRHVEEARIERIQEYSTRQSFLERILQVGTIDFDTASSQQGDLFQFKGIAEPEDVARLVDTAQETHNQRLRAQGSASAEVG